MGRKRLGIAFVPFLLWASGSAPLAAAEETALALSAGSAAGLAHVGVLASLEQEGIAIDAIAGTSMGAIIGALYASGYRAAEIEAIVHSVDWQEVFSRSAERQLVPLAQRLDLVPAIGRVGLESGGVELPPAIQSDYRINRLLIKHLTWPSLVAHTEFDSLPIPFRAVAADLANGEPVVLAHGSLPRAVRASMSIPVLLPAIEDGGRTLVDGGIADDFPVDVARAMGASFVIGVDARLRPRSPEEYRDAAGMAAKVAEVLARANNRSRAQPPDLLIAPDVSGVGVMDYADHARIMALGRQAADSVVAGIPPQLRGSRRRHGRAPHPQVIAIETIEVRGNRSAHDAFVRETFGIEPAAGAVAMDEILRGMDALYATRLFESIWVDFEPDDDQRVHATVEVKETWPWALEGGASYNEADQVGAFARLRNRNVFGYAENLAITGAASDSELRASAEIASNRLLSPAIGYYARTWYWEDKPRLFVAHDAAGRAEFDRWGAAAGFQRPMGPSVLLRAGGAAERVDTADRPAALVVASRERIVTANGLFAWDGLDDRSFPTTGSSAIVSATNGWVRDLQADRSSDYWRMAGQGRVAQSLGKRTVLELGLFAGTSGGDVPAHELFRVGGPTVPGRNRDELWDRQAAAAEISYRMPVWRSFTASVRAGSGNAWANWDRATIAGLHWGFGAGFEGPTLIGPVGLTWGYGDGSESQIYATVGFRQYPMSWLHFH